MINYFKTYLKYYLENDEGQSMVEYVLIIGLVAILLIGVVTAFGDVLIAKFQLIIGNL